MNKHTRILENPKQLEDHWGKTPLQDNVKKWEEWEILPFLRVNKLPHHSLMMLVEDMSETPR